MKVHSTNFKKQLIEMGRELDSIITFGETVLSKEEINAVTPSFQGALLKSVMKQLDIDSNVEIPVGTILNYKFGLKVDNEFEYIDFGNYIVYSVEKKEDTNSFEIVCYDKLLYSMVDYVSLGIAYPISIRDYIIKISEFLGVEFANANDEFANYDKMISNELYLDENNNSLGYTFRDVLDELSQVTASNICINASDELEVRYINKTDDIIDEEYLKDINVNFGEKFGPINTIVLSRGGGADSIYYPDEIPENAIEFKISENQIMNFNDRSDYLQAIYEKLNGLEFYINDFVSTGVVYYDLADMYNVKVYDKIYNCLMLNDEILVTQGLQENIFTTKPEETNTDYSKADKTDRKINQTYIIANKQKGDIEILTSQVNSINDDLGNSYTKEEINQLIQNSQTGLTNTFSEAGGNNIFRNTGLWFEDEEGYEFWKGTANKKTNDQATNQVSILLQEGSFIQEQEVSNGSYTVSFKYRKLIELANASVLINDVEYQLDNLEFKEFYTGEKDEETNEYITQPIIVNTSHLKIEFRSDTNNSVELYDLMANKGAIKLAYSQNENETTTDTVNISKGITITSSNMDVEFKANADGVRVYTTSGEKKTEFTDKGLTTKEAVVEDEAQIVKTLWQEVGEQTWITRM